MSSDQKDAKPREYNPRWKGYVFIIISSLVCTSSSSSLTPDLHQGDWATAIAFSSITFGVALLVLFVDRFQCCTAAFNYNKALDGKLEGYVLGFFVILWIVNVSILTRPGGLAYYASNIYFSSWLALASCVYTLDKWASAKDIISIQELTQLSATLKSWYALFLFSVIAFGSAVSMHVYLQGTQTAATAFCISLGLVSTAIALFFILVHYNFFTDCCTRVKQGGWLELATAFVLIVCWTIAVAVLTKDQGIAATVAGSACKPNDLSFEGETNCNVTIRYMINETYIVDEKQCAELFRDNVPGSNLYFCVWGALLAAVNITLRWKAAQALQFAQAAQQQQQVTSSALPEGEVEVEDDEDAI